MKSPKLNPDFQSRAFLSRRAWGGLILSGCLCLTVCFATAAGVCWAWFDDTVITQPQNLMASTFSQSVTVTKVTGNQSSPAGQTTPANDKGVTGQQDSADGVDSSPGKDPAKESNADAATSQAGGQFTYEQVIPNDDTYTLEADSVYTVAITAQGSAQTGYSLLTVTSSDGTVTVAARTSALQEAQSITTTITLCPEADCALTVTAQWGTADDSVIQLTDGTAYEVLGAGQGFETTTLESVAPAPQQPDAETDLSQAAPGQEATDQTEPPSQEEENQSTTTSDDADADQNTPHEEGVSQPSSQEGGEESQPGAVPDGDTTGEVVDGEGEETSEDDPASGTTEPQAPVASPDTQDQESGTNEEVAHDSTAASPSPDAPTAETSTPTADETA